jgi:dihydroorotate dehydrogenase (fumarate)
MNLSTDYLGLKLRNPLVIGASPCCDSLDACRRLQDAGASALVMHSLFAEQVEFEENARLRLIDGISESNPEALDYFPHYDDYALTPELYLRQLTRLKATLQIPVVASLNAHRPGAWMDHAKRLADAGADALELNLYALATDADVEAADVEAEQIFIVRQVVESVRVPVSVKISPWHTAPANFLRQVEMAGAKGAVLFNRFYQPDFDLEELEVHPHLKLSDSSELLARLRWLAIVSPHTRLSLAASGGVHTTQDFVKALLAGAHAVQLVSAVLRHGAIAITNILGGVETWMRDREYATIDQLRGALNLAHCPNAEAHERANYLQVLQNWRV